MRSSIRPQNIYNPINKPNNRQSKRENKRTASRAGEAGLLQCIIYERRPISIFRGLWPHAGAPSVTSTCVTDRPDDQRGVTGLSERKLMRVGKNTRCDCSMTAIYCFICQFRFAHCCKNSHLQVHSNVNI